MFFPWPGIAGEVVRRTVVRGPGVDAGGAGREGEIFRGGLGAGWPDCDEPVLEDAAGDGESLDPVVADGTPEVAGAVVAEDATGDGEVGDELVEHAPSVAGERGSRGVAPHDLEAVEAGV